MERARLAVVGRLSSRVKIATRRACVGREMWWVEVAKLLDTRDIVRSDPDAT